MKTFSADLHIHTALSPCADDDMTPPAIVEAACAAGLNVIAICDHNSAANTGATQQAAPAGLTVIAGIEITTAEEVHVLGLFETSETAAAAGERVTATLPTPDPGGHPRGRQLILDAKGGSLRIERHALFMASTFKLAGAVDLIHDHGGLAIASHIDRPSYSVLSQLGILPPDVKFDAIELSAAGFRAGHADSFADMGYPLLVSSDSHFLCEIGSCRTLMAMAECSFSGLARAIRSRRHGILQG